MPVAISGLIQLRKDFCGLISGGAFLRGGGAGGVMSGIKYVMS